MNESARCRSGRDVERAVCTRRRGERGKESVRSATMRRRSNINDGNVVVPTGKGAAFEVIEPELTLEVLVYALGSPAFFAETHDLLFAHPASEGREDELGRYLLAFGPLGGAACRWRSSS